MRVLLLFIDGLGVGDPDRDTNPIAASGVKLFSYFRGEERGKPLPFGGLGFSLDAHLGVPGLPQSATGQTTILTGLNAPALEGRHIVGFPTESLRKHLLQSNILKKACEMGFLGTFLNAYRPEIDELLKKRKYRFFSATTVATIGAGLPFRRIEDLETGKAVYQEITNRSLVRMGYDVPVFTPHRSGVLAAELALEHDFSLFEYFQTDRVGHRGDMQEAREQISRLEEFLGAILTRVESEKITVLLVSDHGNIEDIRKKTHTNNRVFAAAWGERAPDLASKLESLLDIRPGVESCLTGRDVPEPAKI